jgi:DNA-binding transcriptional ArsR family regulator
MKSAEKPQINYNKEIVAAVRKEMLSPKYVGGLAAFFKVVGDDTRVKIIYALAERELCVNDLAAALGMSQSAVSHQLKLLRMENQVKARRTGKNIFYSLDDQHVLEILEAALTHIRHKLS